MIDIKLIIKDKELVIKKLSKRHNFNAKEIDILYNFLIEKNTILNLLMKKQTLKNTISAKIGKQKRNKKDVFELLQEVEKIKKEVIELEEKNRKIQLKINNKLSYIPNIPLDEVPEGKDEHDNIIINEYPNIGKGLVKSKKSHYEIGVEKDIIDFVRSSKLSGSRFVLYKKQGSKLIRALESFMLDFHEKNNYIEIMPPLMVNEKMMYGTGQFPKFVEDVFKIENKNLYLIPTAEVPLTNYYNNEIIDLNDTIKFTAFSKCFRSEAGSAGKDTKGIIRMHQFNKVEMLQFTSKENGLKAFESVLNSAKKLLELLELPYREVLLCGGDLGFSSKKTVDLELWLPSEQKYREVSSISYFGDFQSRRAMIRYRDKNKKTQYVHTVNGSGLAIDRVFAAILEQYQNDDGSINVPNILLPYLRIDKF